MTETPTSSVGTALVVDDVDSNRYVLRTWLQWAGYSVIEAATGQAALDAVAVHAPDVVILDVNLPDMSGYDVCERVKGQPHTAAVPVLHISSTAIQVLDRAEGLRRGADMYLIEPVERDEFVASVNAMRRVSLARQAALRLAAQLRKLHNATFGLNSATTADQLVTAVVRGAAAVFDTEVVAVVLVGERGLLARGTVAGIGPVTTMPADELRPAVGDCLAGLPAGVVGRAGARQTDGSWRAVALKDRADRIEGVLLAAVNPADDADADDAQLMLDQFAQAAGLALENVRNYNVEHRIALTLQRSLLPTRMPSIPGLEVVARYEASADRAEVGGDFYEVFELDDDRVVIAVGDAVGHSLQAAALMSQLRNGIRAYALEGHGPGQVLKRLNALMLRFHPDTTATMCYAVYERGSGRCLVANAGHPPPVLLNASGARFLTLGGPLLGVDARPAEPSQHVLAEGDVLVFYTDGLIERRGESLDVGMKRIIDSLSRGHENLDRLCDRLLHDAGLGHAATDDVAIMAVRPRTQA